MFVLLAAAAVSRLAASAFSSLISFLDIANDRAQPAIPPLSSTNCCQLLHSNRFRQMKRNACAHLLAIFASTSVEVAEMITRSKPGYQALQLRSLLRSPQGPRQGCWRPIDRGGVGARLLMRTVFLSLSAGLVFVKPAPESRGRVLIKCADRRSAFGGPSGSARNSARGPG